MLPLRDEPHPIVATEPEVRKHAFEGAAGMGVDDEELVLVKLHLDGTLRMEDRDPGAAVVEEEILEVPKHALEHRPLDPFAGVLDGRRAVAVARLENDVDGVAERFEKAEKGLEEIFARDGTDQRRQAP